MSDLRALGYFWKLSKETNRKSVVALCSWTFFYVRGKWLLMSLCFVIQDLCFVFHITSFKHESGFVQKYIHTVDRCGWSCVTVTWLHSNPDPCTDHPVVFTRAIATEQPILCGLWSTNSLWPRGGGRRIHFASSRRQCWERQPASAQIELLKALARLLAPLKLCQIISYESIITLAVIIVCHKTM